MRLVTCVQAQAISDQWLGQLPVVPFDAAVARTHAALAADLGLNGATMGAHDLLIAATAAHLGYDVATRDRRSFARLGDLNVQYW